MRVCEKCGFIEPMEWHPSTWKSAQYIDVCRVTDLQNIQPDLATKLLSAPKGDTITEGFYAYRITKTGVWVQRRWIEIWKVQKWAEIPMEMHRKPKDPHQTKLHLKEVEKGVYTVEEPVKRPYVSLKLKTVEA